jgi:hypothetical protein
MNKCLFALLFCLCSGAYASYAQLQINAPITITGGAVITVQNIDVITTENVNGNGTIQLTGNVPTIVNGNSKSIPTLEINKTGTDVTLSSKLTIKDALTMISGKLVLNGSDLTLQNAATVTGNSVNFMVTNGSAKVVKELNTNLSNFNLPMGPSVSEYNPITFTTTGAYTAGASLSARAVSATHPNIITANPDKLNVYWPITRSGITGTVLATGTYADPTNIIGTESNIRGAIWNGTNWDFANNANNASANTVTGSLSTANGSLSGTNAFVYVKAKALLQGAMLPSLVMRDVLHNILPTTDPYRSSTYSANFVHVNNPTAEIAAASVLTATTNGNNNIVDWVFLQLRDNSGAIPGGTVIATRAALIQKDGDIVDVDGVSPVLFRNVPNGNAFTLAIRHRNHLGMSTDPATLPLTFSSDPASTTIDFTTLPDAQINGPATAYRVSSGLNQLWAGNARHDTRVAFNGLNNDKDPILAAGNISTIGYYRTDLNMNGTSLRTGLNNDKDFLLITILGSNPTVQRTQSLP